MIDSQIQSHFPCHEKDGEIKYYFRVRGTHAFLQITGYGAGFRLCHYPIRYGREKTANRYCMLRERCGMKDRETVLLDNFEQSISNIFLKTRQRRKASERAME
jgi:hypothetical protein